MNWPQLRKHLEDQSPARILEIVKGLYALSPQNKAYLRKQFAETLEDPAFLEKCRTQIINAIYPPRRKYPDDPKFAQARKAVNEYKKATGDMKGVIDLLLTYVESGTRFTLDFGDIDEPFYERLETALDNAAELILAHPMRKSLYSLFRPRFQKLARDAGWMEWGYGDFVNDTFHDLEGKIGEQ
jgi:hypothetical protein